MSRVLVTGGSGFIGTNVVQHHLDLGDDVVNLDLVAPRCASQAGHWMRGDVTDFESTRRLMADRAPEYVYHLAARTDLGGASLEDYRANTVGVDNMVRAAAASPGVKRVLFASSMLVCRLGYRPTNDRDYCPDTAYGESKVRGEDIVRTGASFEWAIVRPTSIWGPWFAAPYRDFFEAVRRGIYVHPKGVRVRRNYGFVGNVVFELDRLMKAPSEAVVGKTFYACDYEAIDVKSWADMIRAAFGKKGHVPECPVAILAAGARAGDILQRRGVRNPPLTSRRLRNLTTSALCDAEGVKDLCGPLPYVLEQGVAVTVEWMQRR